MPKTVRIPDIDDGVYDVLVRLAGEAGMTVPELMHREATKLAQRTSVAEWLQRTRYRPSRVSTSEVLGTLDEWRGAWPAVAD